MLDDNARVFLSNKLMKLRRKQAQTTVDINGRLKDMEGLLNLKNAYIENNSLGDPEEVQESILEASRAITVLQTMSALYEAEINTIVQTIGGTISIAWIPMLFICSLRHGRFQRKNSRQSVSS